MEQLTEALNQVEQTELQQCEQVIERGLKTFVEVGNALLTIRDKRLYRAEFKTFEDYCNDRWGMARNHAYRFIDAAKVVSNLQMSPIGDMPKNESQARPLTKLEPETQREAWQQVVQEHGDKATAKDVDGIVKEWVDTDRQVKEAKANPMFVAEKPEDIIKEANRLRREKKELERQEREKRIAEFESVDITNDTAPLIYVEDCATFLDTIEDGTIDLVLTDPPYITEFTSTEFYSFVSSWAHSLSAKVKDTGRMFICTGAYPEEIKTYLSVFEHLNGWIVDAPLVWTYRNTLGVTPSMKYNLNYQLIWHLYRDTSHKLDNSVTIEMFSVQDINAPDGRQGDRYHAWQKPDELCRRLITHATKPGDLVLDVFACTGTTLLQASKLGRVAFGCEINKENALIAKYRGCKIVCE